MRFRALLILVLIAVIIPTAYAEDTTTYSNAQLGFSFDYPSSYSVSEIATAYNFSVTVSYAGRDVVTILRTSDADAVALSDPATEILIDGTISAQLSSIYTTDTAIFEIPNTTEYLSINGSGDAFTTILATLKPVDPTEMELTYALGSTYGFAIDLPTSWQDYKVITLTVDSTDALGSYTEWDFYLPTATSTNAYQLFTDSSTYYGKVFALQRYANPNHLSVVAWQNAIPDSVTTSPTALATDGTTIFAYVLDTVGKQYRDFPNDISEPLDDAVNMMASFRFTHTFTDFFSDVPVYHLHRRAIEELSVAGILSGYPDGTFQPDATINRAELTKILVEGLGITPDLATYNHCFPDVTDQWYAPSVCYAQAQGWVQGYPDAKFHPENTVNKVEALKMVVAANGFQTASELTLSTATLFSDTPVSEWYAPYLKTALDRGLIEEPKNALYAPADGRTRGSIAEMIFRVRVAQSIGVDEYIESYRDKVTTGVE